jgi:hypothetical protein
VLTEGRRRRTLPSHADDGSFVCVSLLYYGSTMRAAFPTRKLPVNSRFLLPRSPLPRFVCTSSSRC